MSGKVDTTGGQSKRGPDVDLEEMTVQQLAALRAQGVDAALLGLFFDIPTARVLVLDEDAQEFRRPA